VILAVGNVKGGVGKTTLAVNLVIALSRKGHDALLIDGDEQGTAMAFTELRSSQSDGETGYTAVALHGKAIRDQTRQLALKYTGIVIDVGGRDTGSLRAALTVAEMVIIPVQPRSFDVWGVDQTAELVRDARHINEHLRALVVLNNADSQGKDNEAAAEGLWYAVAAPKRAGKIHEPEWRIEHRSMRNVSRAWATSSRMNTSRTVGSRGALGKTYQGC